MNYKIDRKKDSPAYMQLYYQLRKHIIEGAYLFEDKLPSKRDLATESGCSVITVEHAFDLLMDEGYIKSKERSGYYVIYRKKDFMAAAAIPKTVINDEDTYKGPGKYFPFSILAKTMRKVITDEGRRILVKSDNTGLFELKMAIKNYLLRSRDIDVDISQIVIGSGAEYIYTLIVQLLGRDRVYALEDPSYDKIRKVYESNGADCEMLKMGRNGILSRELDRSRGKVLHVTPYNSYPSGVTATASKRHEYIRWAKKKNAIIIEDDFDSEFTISSKAEDTLFALAGNTEVFYINTFSKTIAPSMRIGYMLLPKSRIGEFERKLGFYSCTVPVFEQYVLAEFINSGDFERHINRTRRRKRKKLKKVGVI